MTRSSVQENAFARIAQYTHHIKITEQSLNEL